MEKKVPLSEKAVYEKIFETDPQTTGLQTGWTILVFIGAFLLFMAFVLEENKPIGLIFPGVILLLAGLAVFRLYLKKSRLVNQRLAEKNLKDWSLSQKIRTATNNLPKIISRHDKMVVPDLRTINNLKPVRIEYLPLQKLEGEFKGNFQGFGLLAVKGSISGEIRGTSIPEPTDENVIIVCTDEKGDSLRLVCLSPRALKRKASNYLQAFANQEYGERSHTQAALYDFWRNPNGLAGILKNLNPQRVYDYLAVKLDLPKEERPNISVNGVMTKEGTLLVSSISCDNKKEEVIPVELMERVNIVLKKILKRPIPSIPLLE